MKYLYLFVLLYTFNLSAEEGEKEIISYEELCGRSWYKLIEEWKANGGGIKESIQATRNQIRNDEVSEFSQFVRKSWSAQKSKLTMKKLWYWPVTDEAFREVSYHSSINSNGLVEERCAVSNWIPPLLWNEIRSLNSANTEKLIETPLKLQWESPYAQQWVYYWLFVAIDE